MRAKAIAEGAALATGNACVLKPAEEACLTALAFAELAHRAAEHIHAHVRASRRWFARRIPYDFSMELGSYDIDDTLGKWSLLFFGYTSCPDACPSTLAKLQRAFNLLSEEQIEQLRTVFVSVDPKRDNPKVLNEYVEYFGVNAIGLTGTKAEIDKVVKAYHAHYMVIPGQTSNWYSINHTTTVFLHDKQGKVRYRFLYEETPEQLAEAIRKYL